MFATFSLLTYHQPHTHLLVRLNIVKQKLVLYIQSCALGMQFKSQEIAVQREISGT